MGNEKALLWADGRITIREGKVHPVKGFVQFLNKGDLFVTSGDLGTILDYDQAVLKSLRLMAKHPWLSVTIKPL